MKSVSVTVLAFFLLFSNYLLLFAAVDETMPLTGINVITIAGSPGQGPGNCPPYPIDPSYSYILPDYYEVSVLNTGEVPGVDLPTMYLAAYLDDPNQIISMTALEFSLNNDNTSLLTSSLTTVELDLSGLSLDCGDESDASPLEVKVKLTIVAMTGNGPVFYPLLHPGLFPSIIFNLNSLPMEVSYYLCCTNLSGTLGIAGTNTETAARPATRREKTPNGEFRIFPNPVRETLRVEFDSPDNGPLFIRVYDAQGKLWWRRFFPAGTGAGACGIAVRDFPPGFYHLVLNTEKDVRTKIFLRQ